MTECQVRDWVSGTWLGVRYVTGCQVCDWVSGTWMSVRYVTDYFLNPPGRLMIWPGFSQSPYLKKWHENRVRPCLAPRPHRGLAPPDRSGQWQEPAVLQVQLYNLGNVSVVLAKKQLYHTSFKIYTVSVVFRFLATVAMCTSRILMYHTGFENKPIEYVGMLTSPPPISLLVGIWFNCCIYNKRKTAVLNWTVFRLNLSQNSSVIRDGMSMDE